MANIVKFGLLLCITSCSVAKLSDAEPDAASPSLSTSTSNPGRMSRKYYDAEIYTGDPGTYPFSENVPRASVVKKYVVPYKHTGSGIMKKSGNNLNWNVWKGDDDDDDNSGNDDGSDNNEGPRWQPPPQAWNNQEAWVADPVTIMMIKNAMSEMKGEDKSTFLSKLTSDPALLLLAASIPISLLLAAALPAVLHVVMGGQNIPTVSTTATGTKARTSTDLIQIDILPYLNPVIDAIGTFGVRSISNPDCMKKIFCEVARDKIGVKDFKYFKKASTVARLLSNGSWLENFGIKDLVDSLSTDSCESIPCAHSTKKGKYRHSHHAHSNSLKK